MSYQDATSRAVPEGPRERVTTGEQSARRSLAVESFGVTDRGLVRAKNEDQFLIASLCKALKIERSSFSQPPVQQSGDRSYLFVVADGMGGHVAGEQASTLAVASVETFVLETLLWFSHLRGRHEDQILADFKQAIGQANVQILSESARDPALHGMGTTLTLAYTLNDVLFVAHVGDSRCYLLRDRELHQLTRDHTLVQDMVREGLLAGEESQRHPLRHVVTNVLGGNSPGVRVDVHRLDLQAGDTLLLCSDGLTEMLSVAAMADVLLANNNAAAACRELVSRANEIGGKDNITAIVARFVGTERQATTNAAS